jgi:hypothetical protein
MNAWLFAQTPRTTPHFFDSSADPFEAAHEESSFYDDWVKRRMAFIGPTNAIVGKHMATYEKFAPRQKSGSFTPKQYNVDVVQKCRVSSSPR